MVTSNYIPSRKIIAGGIASISSWLILLILTKYNFDIPKELDTLLPAIIGTIISYAVPPSVKDVVRRIDNELVAIAAKDNESGVSPNVGVIAAQEAAKESDLIK